jgi:hypothetical protein
MTSDRKLDRKVQWRCLACDWSGEGTSDGFAHGMTHTKRSGKEHEVVLVDRETGEVLTNEKGNPIKSLRTAQKLGLVQKKQKPAGLRSGQSRAMRGKVTAQDVPLDSRLYFLYEWDKIAIPDYDADFSQWIFDCVLGFHIQNKGRFKLEKLFEVAE